MTEDKSLVKSEQHLRLLSSRRQPPLLVRKKIIDFVTRRDAGKKIKGRGGEIIKGYGIIYSPAFTRSRICGLLDLPPFHAPRMLYAWPSHSRPSSSSDAASFSSCLVSSNRCQRRSWRWGFAC